MLKYPQLNDYANKPPYVRSSTSNTLTSQQRSFNNIKKASYRLSDSSNGNFNMVQYPNVTRFITKNGTEFTEDELIRYGKIVGGMNGDDIAGKALEMVTGVPLRENYRFNNSKKLQKKNELNRYAEMISGVPHKEFSISNGSTKSYTSRKSLTKNSRNSKQSSKSATTFATDDYIPNKTASPVTNTNTSSANGQQRITESKYDSYTSTNVYPTITSATGTSYTSASIYPTTTEGSNVTGSSYQTSSVAKTNTKYDKSSLYSTSNLYKYNESGSRYSQTGGTGYTTQTSITGFTPSSVTTTSGVPTGYTYGTYEPQTSTGYESYVTDSKPQSNQYANMKKPSPIVPELSEISESTEEYYYTYDSTPSINETMTYEGDSDYEDGKQLKKPSNIGFTKKNSFTTKSLVRGKISITEIDCRCSSPVELNIVKGKIEVSNL